MTSCFLVCLVRQTSPRLTAISFIFQNFVLSLVFDESCTNPPPSDRLVRSAARRIDGLQVKLFHVFVRVGPFPRTRAGTSHSGDVGRPGRGPRRRLDLTPPQETRDGMPPRPARVALGWIDWTRFGDPARGGGTGRFRKWARSLGPRTLQQDGETGYRILPDPAQRSAMCSSRLPGRGTAR